MTDQSSEDDPSAYPRAWDAPGPYSPPPATSAPDTWSYQPPAAATPYAGPPSPAGYGYPPPYPPQLPPQPYTGYGYPQAPPPVGPPVAVGYGPYYPPPFLGRPDPARLRTSRLVAVLAQVALLLPVVAQFAVAHAVAGQRDAVRRALRQLDDTGFVNMADAHHADDVAHNAALYWIGALIVAGACFTWWLWRMREDADLFDPHIHRRAKGWVIGGWIVPIVSLWFPYQVVADVAKANQPLPTGYDDRRVPTVINFWWGFFLVSVVGARIIIAGNDNTVQEFDLAAKLSYAAGVWSIVTAVLAALVIEQITRSNASRWHAAAPTPPTPPAPGQP